MAGGWHRITEVDTEARTAVCSQCGPTGIRRKGRNPNGSVHWACRTASNMHKRSPADAGRVRGYRRHRGASCERCGLVADHPSLLDVHHRDGDHGNDDPANLATLCPTCHRRAHLGI